MKIHSVKYNFIMNAILTVAGIIFPLITFPYISRVLMVEGSGKVTFAISVVNYFAMFASLGIPTYGVRACAKVRDDKEMLSRTVQELLIISAVTTFLTYVVFGVTLMLVPEFTNRKTLLLIMGLSIGLTSIGVQWLYNALEQYSYITVCSIAFKLLGLILMFCFVKSTEDYLIYGIIYVISTFGSYVLNFIRLGRFISFQKTGTYNFRKHIRPILIFFAMSVATNVYVNLDIVMLGFMKGDVAVGYYNAAVKVKTVLITCVTSLGTVLLPRMSYYVENHDREAFHRMLIKAFRFVFAAAFALSAYFILLSEEAVLLLSGEAFLPAVTPMILLMPTVLLIGLSNITGMQVLTPLGKESKVMISVIWGAVIDVVLNLILIPFYSYSGAALATLIAEVVVLAVQCMYLKDMIKEVVRTVKVWKMFIALLAAVLGTMIVLTGIQVSVFIRLVISAVIFFGIYAAVLWLAKEAFVTEIIQTILEKIAGRKGS